MTALASFIVALVVCELVRRTALRKALLDVANERSLHTAPTPRLGGVAIVVATLVVASAVWADASKDLRVLVGGATAIALMGLRDDLRPLSASVRIAIQVGVASAFLFMAGVPELVVARGVVLPLPAVIIAVLLVVWMVGTLNIYNFMDGMDGLAGFQALTAALSLSILVGGDAPTAAFAVALAGGSVGFLAHNYPPARIFMGDAGSTFIGLSFSALAVIGMRKGVPITESALPLAPFLLDGAFTIFRRALRREAVWRAHRSHLYQRAVQAGLGHRDVLLVYMAWMAVAAGAALLAPLGHVFLAGGWGLAVLGLLAVRAWVLRLERNRSEAA